MLIKRQKNPFRLSAFPPFRLSAFPPFRLSAFPHIINLTLSPITTKMWEIGEIKFNKWETYIPYEQTTYVHGQWFTAQPTVCIPHAPQITSNESKKYFKKCKNVSYLSWKFMEDPPALHVRHIPNWCCCRNWSKEGRSLWSHSSKNQRTILLQLLFNAQFYFAAHSRVWKLTVIKWRISGHPKILAVFSARMLKLALLDQFNA